MINKGRWWVWGLAAGLSACDQPDEHADALQGIVEHETHRVAFVVGGRVTDVFIEAGQVVTPGTMIATLDDAVARTQIAARRAEVEQAKANLALLLAGSRRAEVRGKQADIVSADSAISLARQNFERQRQLLENGASTRATYDNAYVALEQALARRDALEQQLLALREGARVPELDAARARQAAAEAALRTAEVQLRQHVLGEAQGGTVIDVTVERGEVVAGGTPIGVIADLEQPYVDVFVPQASMAQVNLGKRATVEVDGLSAPLQGTVTRIGTQTEFTPKFLFSDRERPNLVVRVRVTFVDPHHVLHAGIPAFVRWHDAEAT